MSETLKSKITAKKTARKKGAVDVKLNVGSGSDDDENPLFYIDKIDKKSDDEMKDIKANIQLLNEKLDSMMLEKKNRTVEKLRVLSENKPVYESKNPVVAPAVNNPVIQSNKLSLLNW